MSKVNLGGRPPMFKTAEELIEKVNDYVKSCVPEYAKDEYGDIVTTDKGTPIVIKSNKPTVTGLAMFLGFESRQSLYDYEAKSEFTYIIKQAKLFVEHSYEEDLRTPGISPSGPIFAMKNMGWSDKQELEHSGQINSNNLSREELDKEIEELEKKLGRK